MRPMPLLLDSHPSAYSSQWQTEMAGRWLLRFRLRISELGPFRQRGDLPPQISLDQSRGGGGQGTPWINPRKYVLRLHKALYGLKQGARSWYESLKAALEQIGFKCTEMDHGVFVKQWTDGSGGRARGRLLDDEWMNLRQKLMGSTEWLTLGHANGY